MAFVCRLLGRMEKRLPIMIVVRLMRVQEHTVDGDELTYTDNISAHGARVISDRAWQAGEAAVVTSLKDESSIRGKVVYCQKLPDNRYCVGLAFQNGGIPWSNARTYLAT